MAYIGLPPKANFTSGLLDRFTSTTGTTVTLTNDISSENDIVVFVNFVKQDSTTYSVGGTGNKTLTLGGTLVSSDIVEVHYLNIVGQTVAPSSGSVTTATINDNAVTGAKLNADVISSQTELASGVASTDELLISDAGVLKRVDVSLVGGTQTPNFFAYRSGSAFSLGSSSYTKVIFNSTKFDTASAYNTSTALFTCPSGQAGKYFLGAQIFMGGSTDPNRFILRMRLNNSSTIFFTEGQKDQPSCAFSSTIYSLSEGDTVQVDAYQDTGSAKDMDYSSSGEANYFFGYKVIE